MVLTKGQLQGLLSRKFLFIYLWQNSVYTQLHRYISCKYIFTLYDLGIDLQIFLIFEFFVDPTHHVNQKGKQNSEKIQRVKIRLNLKTNDISMTINSNLLYFNFTKSRQKTLETINVLNICRNNVDIALANCVIKQLKSTYLYSSMLVFGLYHTH